MFASWCVFGIFCLEGELKDYELFSNPESFLKLKEGEVCEELIKLSKRHGDLILEDERIAEKLGLLWEFPNPAGIFLRKNLFELAKRFKIDLKNLMHETSLKLARSGVRKASGRRDRMIISGVKSMEDLDSAINLFSERLREWFSLYNPELAREISSNLKFAERVLNLDVMPSEMGAELSEEDRKVIVSLAQTTLDLFEQRRRTEEYVTKETTKLAPNVSSLLGAILTAKLISAAGGLKELAILPSSTVQLLGAEKALFRHLRYGASPPKHGLIFSYPLISSSAWWQRGKIARTLASKIAILAKVDHFGGEFVADDIENEILKRVESVRRAFPKPPRKKPKRRFKR
ncbi:MAG: C/D box methylation guide ribonucleoprotein complex aNOP56 subunit [Candidatus Methanofastidiosia archaeon]